MTEKSHIDNLIVPNVIKDFSEPTANQVYSMVMGAESTY